MFCTYSWNTRSPLDGLALGLDDVPEEGDTKAGEPERLAAAGGDVTGVDCIGSEPDGESTDGDITDGDGTNDAGADGVGEGVEDDKSAGLDGSLEGPEDRNPAELDGAIEGARAEFDPAEKDPAEETPKDGELREGSPTENKSMEVDPREDAILEGGPTEGETDPAGDGCVIALAGDALAPLLDVPVATLLSPPEGEIYEVVGNIEGGAPTPGRLLNVGEPLYEPIPPGGASLKVPLNVPSNVAVPFEPEPGNGVPVKELLTVTLLLLDPGFDAGKFPEKLKFPFAGPVKAGDGTVFGLPSSDACPLGLAELKSEVCNGGIFVNIEVTVDVLMIVNG